jgi:hypothetical protein
VWPWTSTAFSMTPPRPHSRLAAAVDAFDAAGSPLLAAEAALDLADLGVPLAAEGARALRNRLAPAVVTPRLSRAS